MKAVANVKYALSLPVAPDSAWAMAYVSAVDVLFALQFPAVNTDRALMLHTLAATATGTATDTGACKFSFCTFTLTKPFCVLVAAAAGVAVPTTKPAAHTTPANPTADFPIVPSSFATLD